MDVMTFEANLKAKKLEKRLWIFSGKEEFLKEKAVERVLLAFVAREDVAENVTRLDCQQASPDEVLGKLQCFPFNSSLRIILVYHPEGLTAAERKVLCGKLATGPIPEDVLFIFFPQESSLAAELAKLFGEKAERVDFWPPFENQMNSWVVKEAREGGSFISPEAADKLLEKIGPDLRVLHQELVKLCFQAGPDGKIMPDLVEKNVSYLRQDTVFDLLEHIGYRRLPDALRVLHHLLQTGESPIMLWTMISRMLRDFRLLFDLAVDRPDLVDPILKNLKELLKLSSKSDFKANQEKKRLIAVIQEEARQWPPFLLENLRLDQPMQVRNLSMALNYRREHLLALWPKMTEMDLALKSTLGNVVLTFQEFLIHLIPSPSR